MKIPQYWAKATAEEVDQRGRRQTLSCWRSSDTSPQDAQQLALTAATRILRSFLGNRPLERYSYGSVPMREEVVQRFEDDAGTLTAAVTRNNYGTLVLNTARVMFVDIDFPEKRPSTSLGSLFGRIFGRNAPPAEPDYEKVAREQVASFVRENREWGMRLYRTHSGLRLLVTHDLFKPTVSTTQEAFQALAADPLYMQLCQAQQSFRARLTPKPWRCGHYPASVRWPRETEQDQLDFDTWQQGYQECLSGFATCRFLESAGTDLRHPAVEQIIHVHDHLTRCREPLPLA